MRKYLVLATLVVAPAAVAADPPQVTIVSGSAAIASFEHVSDDGCITTFGEIAVVNARRGGELADGLYVTGMQDDSCGGFGNGFAGFATGSFSVTGLITARFTGDIVVESYSGGAPVTLELDLRWIGRGAVTRTHGVFHDDGQIDFSFSASRDARTTGTFTIDGDPVTVTSATLVREAHGTITH